ncbi:hypothetical protein GCM10025778_23010 [Paeniglutamicibacter antarcticus]|uniref:Right handed beta helix domain-containing protein n=2 Tax=Paeniglutamicibacter antarcticus TaxID=494023 RepID=A0ABP9TPJ1_9MICC
MGPSYTLNEASRFSMAREIGAFKVLPGKNSTATAALEQRDVAAGVDVSFDSLPTSGSLYANIALRHSGASHYEGSLRLTSDGALRLEVSKHISGTKTIIKSTKIASNVIPGKTYHLDFEVGGKGQTRLKARASQGSAGKDWQIEHTDSGSAQITTAGNLRIGGYQSASAKKASGIHVDNLRATQSSDQPKVGLPPVATPPVANEPIKPPPEQPQQPDSETRLPSNALYVATSGRSSASGTSKAPMKSLSQAVSKASNGQTIVVRGGTYHESVTIPTGKTLHLRSYPGEHVWMDGSSTLSGFSASSGGYATAWKHDFDSSPTFTRGAKDSKEEAWGFVNSQHPMAAHPEQVWVDEKRQVQVKKLTALKPGSFYVDGKANKLYLGTNPSGKNVEATTLVKALSIRGAKSSIDGINVRRFAPSVPDMGAITAEKPGIVLKNMTVEDSSTTGINVSAVNNKISNVTIRRSGMLGVNAVYADGLQVNHLNSSDNNLGRFNSSPVSGGLKITRSRGIDVKNSQFLNNYGPGLWIDESVYDTKVVNNDMIRNKTHGLSLEISAKATVANNRIIGNGGNGIKLNNTSDVAIWNNTISGPNRAINIVQDKRRGANNGDAGHDPRQSFPDATMPWVIKNVTVKNNVLSNTGGGNAILAVEDFSKKLTAEDMKISLNANAYHRTSAKSPKWSVVWSKGAGNPSVYTTLAAFQKAKPTEGSSFEITATSIVDGNNNTTTSVTGKNRKATALPANIASLTGLASGSKLLGASKR